MNSTDFLHGVCPDNKYPYLCLIEPLKPGESRIYKKDSGSIPNIPGMDLAGLSLDEPNKIELFAIQKERERKKKTISYKEINEKILTELQKIISGAFGGRSYPIIVDPIKKYIYEGEPIWELALGDLPKVISEKSIIDLSQCVKLTAIQLLGLRMKVPSVEMILKFPKIKITEKQHETIKDFDYLFIRQHIEQSDDLVKTLLTNIYADSHDGQYSEYCRSLLVTFSHIYPAEAAAVLRYLCLEFINILNEKNEENESYSKYEAIESHMRSLFPMEEPSVFDVLFQELLSRAVKCYLIKEQIPFKYMVQVMNSDAWHYIGRLIECYFSSTQAEQIELQKDYPDWALDMERELKSMMDDMKIYLRTKLPIFRGKPWPEALMTDEELSEELSNEM